MPHATVVVCMAGRRVSLLPPAWISFYGENICDNDRMHENERIDFLQLREAIEASWDERTSYLGVSEEGNPALGQCYPTARVVQFFFPETEILKGNVWNGKEIHVHFWNGLFVGKSLYHIDLSWQQFPPGSFVRDFQILNRNDLGDGPHTIERCDLLRKRVVEYLQRKKA